LRPFSTGRTCRTWGSGADEGVCPTKQQSRNQYQLFAFLREAGRGRPAQTWRSTPLRISFKNLIVLDAAEFSPYNKAMAEFQEVYRNSYLRGILAGPFLVNVFCTLVAVAGLGLPTIFLLAIPVYLAQNWHQNIVILSQQTPAQAVWRVVLTGLAILAGLMLAFMIVYLPLERWRVFGRLVRSRAYLLSGLQLAMVEGPPVFSGRTPAYAGRRGTPLKTLHAGGHEFDLKSCGHLSKLLTIGERPLVDTRAREAADPGTQLGFKIRQPIRVWYVPSTNVIVNVEVPTVDLSHRIEMLVDRLRRFDEKHQKEYSH